MRASEWIWVAALALAFTPGVLAMAEVWGSVEYYSHGYMIPLVALWAASAQFPRLASLPSGHDWRGLLGIGLALGLYLFGLAGGIPFWSGLGVVAAVASGVLLLRGAAWLRALSFAIAYLLFMVPLPEPWLTPVIVQLQLWVSTAGVWLLRSVGVAIFRDGNVIGLPGGEQLFVAEACSGITSLITLIPLGVFLAWFTEQRPARRALLVASVLPVALLGNLLRVVVTVLAAERLGAERALGSALHDWTGVFTYVLACVVLLGLGAAMRRWWPEGETPTAGQPA
jgi:exosortase